MVDRLMSTAFFHGAMIAVAALALASGSARAKELREVVVTEPVHGITYLPLYLAQTNGYFADEGLSVKVLTMNGGAAHTNAVLSGQALAFIGGPEHNAFAETKGAELRAVINVVDRGNVYFVARSGLTPAGTDYKDFVKGKRIATFFLGGTPNSITRYMLDQWGLDPTKDVTLIETNNPGILSAVAAKQADIGAISDPELTEGVERGIWQEPFYNVPKELGPYAYSALNVRLDVIQKDPKLVASFVRGVLRGLQYCNAHPKEAAEVAEKWFPTMPLAYVTATIDRTVADKLWSADGTISEQSWKTAEAVVRSAGILKTDVPYDKVIDMQFVKQAMSQK